MEQLPSAGGRGSLHPGQPAPGPSSLAAPDLQEPQASDRLELEALNACGLLGAVLEGFGVAMPHSSCAAKPFGPGPLDFDDLELCARELLERHEGVRGSGPIASSC